MIEKSKKYLVDSNIIIYHLNGVKEATDFLIKNLDKICISRITFIEVLSFDFDKEDEKNVVKLLNSFEIIDTNENIALKSIENRKVKKIKLADNIISSTAQSNDLILVTRNIKDFSKLNLKVLNIFKHDELTRN